MDSRVNILAKLLGSSSAPIVIINTSDYAYGARLVDRAIEALKADGKNVYYARRVGSRYLESDRDFKDDDMIAAFVRGDPAVFLHIGPGERIPPDISVIFATNALRGLHLEGLMSTHYVIVNKVNESDIPHFLRPYIVILNWEYPESQDDLPEGIPYYPAAYTSEDLLASEMGTDFMRKQQINLVNEVLQEVAPPEEDVIGLSWLIDYIRTSAIYGNNGDVILLGPPGTGKTHLGLNISRHFPTLIFRFEAIFRKFVGESERVINDVLRRVENYFRGIPAGVLILDEIGRMIVGNGVHSSDVSPRVIGRFLTWWSTKPNNIVVIATLNDPRMVDQAILRRASLTAALIPPPPDVLIDIVRYYVDLTNKRLPDGVSVKEDDVLDVLRKMGFSESSNNPRTRKITPDDVSKIVPMIAMYSPNWVLERYFPVHKRVDEFTKMINKALSVGSDAYMGGKHDLG